MRILLVGYNSLHTLSALSASAIRSFPRRHFHSPSNMVKIGTHDGTFHCDEALACFMLKQIPQYKDATVVRSRDPAVLDACDIVVDVGGTYDAAKHRYDHHQRGFEEVLGRGFATKLSSAGLVYKHFGKDFINSVVSVDEKTLELVYDKVYENFVEAVDAVDNGINQYPTDIKPLYKVNTSLGSRVSKLNPSWNEEGIDVEERFRQAMQMTGSELVAAIEGLVHSWLPARSIVADGLAKRMDLDPSGRILRLDQFCPWKAHLNDLEKEQGIEGQILYVLYGDSSGKWRVQCVSLSETSFENRKSLPEKWRGVRDDALSQLSGIDGCIFVHASGFIAGNVTFEGALAMARASLTMD
eukprot:GFYU01009105.1.p1 GENE.GFYU01009105.1~~GFYU01009105.1.p1  ORF type:complete len:355 (+),score=90.06 GFYU01009105.1:33-1097(+)